MANQDVSHNWDQFVEVAEKAIKKEGSHEYNVFLCKYALKVSEILTLDDDIVYEHELYLQYVEKLFTILDEEGDILQRTVREHFLILHSDEPSDFSIKFTEKIEETAICIICDVKFSGMDHRLYIKYHKRDPQSSSSSIENPYSISNRPFLEEMFVYKLLSLIKVGGEVYFPISIYSKTPKNVYVAMEEINFTTAKKLTIESANFEAMILIDFLQFVLRLEDIGKNEGDFGQNDEGEPVIVDFWINEEGDCQLSDCQINDFWNTIHPCYSPIIADAVKSVTRDQRKKIIDEAMEKWDLMNRIDQTSSYFKEYFAKYVTMRENYSICYTLNQYARRIKYNIDEIIKQSV